MRLGAGGSRRTQSGLDRAGFDRAREQALAARCAALRSRLTARDPAAVAALAAMALVPAAESEKDMPGRPAAVLRGHLWGRTFTISWPDVQVRDAGGERAGLREELLWLHYLDRADGSPLSGRAVTLRELGGGGMFYQQAFQGYAGDALARSWGSDLQGLARRCREDGGWAVPGPADLNFEWLALPRVPILLHYRAAGGPAGPQAAVLFDAVAGHYIAVDVAAILGKTLVDRLTRGRGGTGHPPEETAGEPKNNGLLF